MALTERLALVVSLDADGAIKGLNNVGKAADRNLGRTENKLDRTAQKFQKAGLGMLAAAGLAATGLYKAGQSAADLEQAVGGTEAVFKDASGTIERFAKDSAQNMGLSERAFREATTSIGGQLKGLGFSTDDAADKAIELTGVAADLAATYGGTTADAVQALGAAFRGEADPAERFNLRLNQNTVNAKAVALGLAETTSKVDAQAKAQATLALITEQSADAQGQFAREAGTASGAIQIARAEFENVKASLGELAAPIMADVASGLSSISSGFMSLNQTTGGALSKVATFGTIALGTAGAVSFVVGELIEMRQSLSKVGSGLLNASGGLNKLGMASGAVVGAAALTALTAYSMGLDDITINVDELALALGNLDSAARKDIEQLIEIADAAGQLDDVVAQTADTNVAAATRLIDYAEANDLAADKVSKLRDIVKDKQDADIQAAEDQRTNTSAINEAIGPTGELEGATEGLTGAVDDATEAFEGFFSVVLKAADVDLRFRESVDKTEDALLELAEAQAAAAAAGGNNREANERLEDALFNAEGRIYDQAEANVELAEQAGLTGDKLDNVLRASLSALAGDLAPGSPLRQRIEASIAQLDRMATDREATFTLKILEQRVSLQARRDITERAAGGPVTAGVPYIVGERGPELFTPAASGSITPNHALGGSTFNVNVNGPVTRPLVDDMIYALRVEQVRVDA